MSCCRSFICSSLLPHSSPFRNLRRSFLTSHFPITQLNPHLPELHPEPEDLVIPSEQGPSSSSSYISQDQCLNLLSHCNSRALNHGICIHSPIIKLCLHDHLLLNNHLLSLYSKCCGVDQARDLFDGLPCRDVASWTTVISAYARSGLDEDAIELFERMLMSGESTPNQFTFSSILRCASSLRAFDLGTCTHARIIKHGHQSNPVLGSALIDLYAKCDKLEEASRVFDLMGYRDAIAWTTVISASVQAEDWGGAMQLYTSMLGSRVSPNEFTFAKLLTACGGFLGVRQGELVHAHLIISGAELNLVLKTALVDMYSKCHRMSDALKVMRQTPESDVMLCTAMVSGYTQAGDYKAAIAAFQEMEIAGVSPNSFTYAGILHACSCIPAPELGKQIHSQVVKSGLEHDVSVGNALVDLYTKVSPNVEDPVRAFQAIISPNVVSWTALIAGLGRHGRDRDALAAFTEMRVAGVKPNSFTLSTILKGCGGGSLEALAHARKLHAYVLKTRLDSSDTTVGNSLVDVYARAGRADDAWDLSSSIPRRDVFTYTSLAKGLNQMGLHREALGMIARMRDEDVKMDGFSLACFLSASAGLAAIEYGKQLHCYSVKSGLCSSWISVSNGLVDMYGKCGSMSEARVVFTVIPEPNVVSWNGLISGLASNGHFSEALSAFEEMVLAEAGPDGITFLLVLYACSHGGLIDLGVDYFNSMSELYGVAPQPDHYVCLVDLLGRAGRLEEAACAIETMPFQPDALIYKTLLGSCKVHGNMVLGECTARRALEIDPSDPAIYVLLAGVYDDAGKVEWGEQTRRMMRETGMRKCPGQSWMVMSN